MQLFLQLDKFIWYDELKKLKKNVPIWQYEKVGVFKYSGIKIS